MDLCLVYLARRDYTDVQILLPKSRHIKILNCDLVVGWLQPRWQRLSKESPLGTHPAVVQAVRNSSVDHH